MKGLEVDMMDELNQNGDSLVECDLPMWWCHMLNAIMPHAAAVFLEVCSGIPSMTLCSDWVHSPYPITDLIMLLPHLSIA